MNQSLETNPCPCGGTAKEVIYAAKKIRRGWYCPDCGVFTAAILRERILKEKADA